MILLRPEYHVVKQYAEFVGLKGRIEFLHQTIQIYPNRVNIITLL